MPIESNKITIISSTKVDANQLTLHGHTSEKLPESILRQRKQEKRCNVCCMLYGAAISTMATACVSTAVTAFAIQGERRVKYSINGLMRQIAWFSLPGVLTGATLHLILAEAMWSGKHNSWGQAWMKAIVVNTSMWLTAIGAGTCVWRKLLPTTAAGRRLYHRYGIPSQALEVRVLRNSNEWLSGMGWSYWLSGVGSGQIGFATCVLFSTWTDRAYMMMNPNGGYARRCMPPWRREQFARLANVEYEGRDK